MSRPSIRRGTRKRPVTPSPREPEIPVRPKPGTTTQLVAGNAAPLWRALACLFVGCAGQTILTATGFRFKTETPSPNAKKERSDFMTLTATATQGFEDLRPVGYGEVFWVPGDPGVTYVRGDKCFMDYSTAGAEGCLLQGTDSLAATIFTVVKSTVCPAATQ